MKRALVIGCNYTGTSAALNGCINDTETLKEILVSQFRYPAENITILTDDSKVKPTRANILAELEKLIADPLATELWISFSGHGSYQKDENGDESDGRDENICPLDYSTAGMITDDTLKEMLDRIPASKRVNLFMDSCHSGTVADQQFAYSYEQVPKTKRVRKRVRRGRRMVWRIVNEPDGHTWVWKPREENAKSATKAQIFSISGCLDTKFSADWYVTEVKRTQGALTYAFSVIVKEAHGKLTCQELCLKLNEYMKKHGLEQTPVLASSFPIDETSLFVEKPKQCCIQI